MNTGTLTQTSNPRQTSTGTLFLRSLWNALLTLVGAYGLSLSGFILLRLLMGDQGEAVNTFALLNNIFHLMLLPTLLLLPLVLILRRWLLVLFLLLPFTITTVTYLVPPLTNAFTPPPTPAGQPVSVLSYNLLSRPGPFDETIAIIQQANADIVALQEVSETAATTLATVFVDAYPYQALHPHRHGTKGQGLLSRYPITTSEFFEGTVPVTLGHQRAELNIHGTPVVIYNVHPAHPGMAGMDASVRSQDIGAIRTQAETEAVQNPVLVVGDFNMTDQTDDYVDMAATFTDSYREAGRGLGYTFPDAQTLGHPAFIPPVARIDYIFHSKHWQATTARVWDHSGGSDHRPLYAELVLLDDSHEITAAK